MKKIELLLACATICFPVEAIAQTQKDDTQYYISGNIGAYGFAGTGNEETLASDSTGAVHLRGGVKFAKIFAVEGEAGMGLGDIPINTSSDLAMDYQFAGYGIARIPIGKNNRDRADLFLRLGYHVSRFSISGFANEESRTENGVAFGLGGNYYIRDNIGVRVDISSYRIADDFFNNANENSYLGLSVGAVTRF